MIKWLAFDEDVAQFASAILEVYSVLFAIDRRGRLRAEWNIELNREYSVNGVAIGTSERLFQNRVPDWQTPSRVETPTQRR